MALERNVKKSKISSGNHTRRNVWLLIVTLLLIVVSVALFIPPQDRINLGLDIRGGLSVVMTAESSEDEVMDTDDMEDARSIIESRVNALGASEATVQVQGTNQILVQIPGVEDSSEALDTIGTTGQLVFTRLDSMTDESVVSQITAGNYGQSATITDDYGNTFPSEEKVEVEVPEGTYDVLLTGDNINRVTVGRESETSTDYAVNLELDAEGTEAFAQATADLVSTNGQIVIILDNKVQSAPAVQSEITNGQVAITGNYDSDEAKAFKAVLESGSLPINFEISTSQVVGPTLGIDALWAGLLVVIIGLICVMIYLLVFYKGLGIITASAMLVFSALYLGILSALSIFGLFSLSLAGVAGIVLTIGMAADSSILTVERFREEIRMGKSVRAASISGVRHAIFTSIDADLVTLVSALCLFFLASAGVKGFGLTLSLGIFCDIIMMLLFKAPLIRLLAPRSIQKHPGFWGIKDSIDASHFYTNIEVAKDESKSLAEFGKQANEAKDLDAANLDSIEDRSFVIEAAKKIKGRFIKYDINFLGHRKVFLIIAACCMVVCLSGMGIRGFNFGIEFIGGSSITYTNTGDTTSDQLREALAEVGLDDVAIQTASTGGETGFLVRTTTTDAQTVNDAAQAVSQSFGWDSNECSVDTIGPDWGTSVIQSSLIAFVVSILLIIVYIAIRFEFKMGVIAIVALFHDLILVLGIYAIVGREVNPNTIAALLTILGYSLYDTVVVFHRINDNMQGEGIRCTFMAMANHSMNQVLIRTINTTLTSFVPVFAMLIFGGETLKDFAFAMSIGLIAGSYSSIAVAVPLYSMWKTREPRYKKLVKKFGTNITRFTFEAVGSGEIAQVPLSRIEAMQRQQKRAAKRAEKQGSASSSKASPKLETSDSLSEDDALSADGLSGSSSSGDGASGDVQLGVDEAIHKTKDSSQKPASSAQNAQGAKPVKSGGKPKKIKRPVNKNKK